VRHRRLFVLAVLLYVTLDLSLPGMPGVFVFDPADSAEGTHTRTRAAAETSVLPTQGRGLAFALFQPPLEVKERLAPVALAERREWPGAGWRSRAFVDSAPPSEPPH
jgi:hypothetical protein